jgi:hypothetical protein|tara:strand:- start:349 stop:606 length:258 start_codon:yes stop_codon:yes gene_type:complete
VATPSLSSGGIMNITGKNKKIAQDILGNWKKCPSKGFPYEGDIDDPKYLKDRAKLFAESGNGWWWFQGARQQQSYGKTVFRKKRR